MWSTQGALCHEVPWDSHVLDESRRWSLWPRQSLELVVTGAGDSHCIWRWSLQLGTVTGAGGGHCSWGQSLHAGLVTATEVVTIAKSGHHSQG